MDLLNLNTMHLSEEQEQSMSLSARTELDSIESCDTQIKVTSAQPPSIVLQLPWVSLVYSDEDCKS